MCYLGVPSVTLLLLVPTEGEANQGRRQDSTTSGRVTETVPGLGPWVVGLAIPGVTGAWRDGGRGRHLGNSFPPAWPQLGAAAFWKPGGGRSVWCVVCGVDQKAPTTARHFSAFPHTAAFLFL